MKTLKKHKDLILNDAWVSIDPSSKSMGYALVEKGEIIANGVIKTKKVNIGERLNDLMEQLAVEVPEVALVAIEFVRTGTGHHYLVWSTGMAVGAIGAPITIEIPTSLWKKCVDDDYYKSDAMDAKYIAKFILEVIKD